MPNHLAPSAFSTDEIPADLIKRREGDAEYDIIEFFASLQNDILKVSPTIPIRLEINPPNATPVFDLREVGLTWPTFQPFNDNKWLVSPLFEPHLSSDVNFCHRFAVTRQLQTLHPVKELKGNAFLSERLVNRRKDHLAHARLRLVGYGSSAGENDSPQDL
jgi:hypothetical protein